MTDDERDTANDVIYERAPDWQPPIGTFPRRVALFLRKLGEDTMPMSKVREIVFAQRDNDYLDQYAASEHFTSLEREMAHSLTLSGDELDALLKLRGEHWQMSAALADKKAGAWQRLYAAACQKERMTELRAEALAAEVKALRVLLPQAPLAGEYGPGEGGRG